MINYISFGDIFNIQGVDSYAHGCNCAGAMGKGIAIQFREKYPQMYSEYKTLCRKKEFVPGDVFIYNHGNGYVFNLGTQLSWRTKAEINYIEESVNKMFIYASENNIKSIALPKIGAGLGGLNWSDVKNSIEKVAGKYNSISLYIVEEFKKEE